MEYGFLHKLPPELTALLQKKLQPEICFEDVVKHKEKIGVIEFRITITTNSGRFEKVISTTNEYIKDLLEFDNYILWRNDVWTDKYTHICRRHDSIVINDWVLTKELSAIFITKLRELVR